MADGHPLVAGTFLALAIGGVGYGTTRAVVGQREAAVARVAAAEAERKAMLTDGVQRGQQGDFEGAVLVLTRLVREHPDDGDAAYNLGVALGALGRHDDAERVLSGLLARTPDDWGATAELAAVYDTRGDGERALQLLEKVPAGEGDLVARFSDPQLWATTRSHARFEALRAKHGLAATSTATPNAAQLPDALP